MKAQESIESIHESFKSIRRNLIIIGLELIVLTAVLCGLVIGATISVNEQATELNKQVDIKMQQIESTFTEINNKFDKKERDNEQNPNN